MDSRRILIFRVLICMYKVMQDDCIMQIVQVQPALQTAQKIAMHAHHPNR